MRKRMIRYCSAFVILLPFTLVPLYGQSLGDSLEKKDSSSSSEQEESMDDFSDFDTSFPPRFTFTGFTELENFVSTYPDQEPSDFNKKNEIRTKLDMKYGTDTFYVKSVLNLYVMPTFIEEDFYDEYRYSDQFRVMRNGSISNEAFEVNIRELFVNYASGKYRLRAGNQVFNWGTADVFNPTAYFNPFDLRELLFKDDDELKLGVPAVSAMLFLDWFNIETVFVPLHVGSAFPVRNNFWAIEYREAPFPVEVIQMQEMEVTAANMGYGIRLTKNIRGVDVSASGYHGPDREPFLRPLETEVVPNQPVTVLVQPETRVINAGGMDVVFTWDRFTIQGEGAFTMDKPGVVEQEFSQNVELPFQVKRSPHYAYAVGFNYFVPMDWLLEDHAGNTLFTVEWAQSKYTDSSLMAPLFSDILTMRFEDQYWDNRIEFKLTYIMDVKESAFILWPEMGYDFRNGFKMNLAYQHIEGNNDSLFNYYEDNDFIKLGLQYAF